MTNTTLNNGKTSDNEAPEAWPRPLPQDVSPLTLRFALVTSGKAFALQNTHHLI